MKNPRLVKALEEMNKARSAVWSAWSARWSVKTNEKEVLEILKEKLNEKRRHFLP